MIAFVHHSTASGTFPHTAAEIALIILIVGLGAIACIIAFALISDLVDRR